MGLKVMNFKSWVGLFGDQPPSKKPTKHFLISTKDASITQETPWDLGTLCQEQGQRLNNRTKDPPSALIT